MHDKILIKRIINGDTNAFEQLIDKYNGYIATIILNIIGSQLPKEDIQEVINDVFFLLWKNRNKLDMNTYPEIKQYLSAIARNEAKDKLKSLKPTLPLNESIFISSQNEIETCIQRKWMQECINELSLIEQIVLVKYYYKGESIKQIAIEEGIPESTVKTRMKRGKEHLKILLEKGEPK